MREAETQTCRCNHLDACASSIRQSNGDLYSAVKIHAWNKHGGAEHETRTDIATVPKCVHVIGVEEECTVQPIFVVSTRCHQRCSREAILRPLVSRTCGFNLASEFHFVRTISWQTFCSGRHNHVICSFNEHGCFLCIEMCGIKLIKLLQAHRDTYLLIMCTHAFMHMHSALLSENISHLIYVSHARMKLCHLDWAANLWLHRDVMNVAQVPLYLSGLCGHKNPPQSPECFSGGDPGHLQTAVIFFCGSCRVFWKTFQYIVYGESFDLDLGNQKVIAFSLPLKNIFSLSQEWDLALAQENIAIQRRRLLFGDSLSSLLHQPWHAHPVMAMRVHYLCVSLSGIGGLGVINDRAALYFAMYRHGNRKRCRKRTSCRRKHAQK